MAIPYTVRKPSGTYHFRWCIPDDYRHLGNELRLSLATTDKHEARAKAATLRLKVDSLVHMVETLDELRQQLSERPQRQRKPRQTTSQAKASPDTLSTL